MHHGTITLAPEFDNITHAFWEVPCSFNSSFSQGSSRLLIPWQGTVGYGSKNDPSLCHIFLVKCYLFCRVLSTSCSQLIANRAFIMPSTLLRSCCLGQLGISSRCHGATANGTVNYEQIWWCCWWGKLQHTKYFHQGHLPHPLVFPSVQHTPYQMLLDQQSS